MLSAKFIKWYTKFHTFIYSDNIYLYIVTFSLENFILVVNQVENSMIFFGKTDD